MLYLVICCKIEMAFLSTTGRVRVRSRRLLLHLRDRSRSLHLHPATDRAAYFLSSRVRSRRLLFTPPRPIAQTTFPTRQSELQDSVEAYLNKSKGLGPGRRPGPDTGQWPALHLTVRHRHPASHTRRIHLLGAVHKICDEHK